MNFKLETQILDEVWLITNAWVWLIDSYRYMNIWILKRKFSSFFFFCLTKKNNYFWFVFILPSIQILKKIFLLIGFEACCSTLQFVLNQTNDVCGIRRRKYFKWERERQNVIKQNLSKSYNPAATTKNNFERPCFH